jgi:phosphatidylserine/phosphatidylglycerophosphate/cardiolipin synthase-like enzyme
MRHEAFSGHPRQRCIRGHRRIESCRSGTGTNGSLRPAETLEHIDVELIDSARHEIDFAAYVLTDWPVMQALIRAAERGAKVRIYLDASQLAEREPAKVFQDLAQTRGVEIRVKRENSALMHLKSYEIDGHLLRTGAANFSASGLKRQDNDLIVKRTCKRRQNQSMSLKHGLRVARYCRLEAAGEEMTQAPKRFSHCRCLPTRKQQAQLP